MPVSFSETLEQERARLLRVVKDSFEKLAASDGEKELDELLATATAMRIAVDDILKQRADVLSNDELIGLQSALHSALDERIQAIVKEHCQRRFRRLTELAWHDSLTGLLNRAAFEQRVNEEVARGLRHGRELTLVMFDVDEFKTINDSFGHQTGDKVLVCVAKALQSSFRLSDPVFRYGGDEFVALCPETSGAVIESALGRIEKQLSVFIGEAGFIPNVGISWGIASLPTDAINTYEMIRLADQRLYLHKQDRQKRHNQSVQDCDYE